MTAASASFTCPRCGVPHSGVPLAWGPAAPLAAERIPQDAWAGRVRLSEDDCVIDAAQFFVRGCLDIRIRGNADPFRWLVWVAVDQKGHNLSMSLWRRLLRRKHEPYQGTLDTALPYPVPTEGLAVTVRSAGPGMRPQIEVHDRGHPLGTEQQLGLPLEDAYERAAALLHQTRAA